MSGLETMVAPHSSLELVDYQIAGEEICVSIGVCSDFLCREVCADLCYLVGGGGGCEDTTCCCDCL
jgi:hypothetical protein